MAINLTEEYSNTTKNLSDAELCAVAETIAATAVEDLTRWHPLGTSPSARKALIVGALDELVHQLGDRTELSQEAIEAIDLVWAKLGDLNAVN